MRIKKFRAPRHLKDKTYFSGKAGTFSGVPQRTVQLWTEKSLIIQPTEGTGDRRHYTVLNCIEIGLVKELAKDRQGFKLIAQIMEQIRAGTPLTLEQALGYDEAFLIVRFYQDWKPEISCISRDLYGPRSGVEGETRTFEQFWQDTTIPKDPKHIKTLVVDLTYVATKVLSKM